MAKTNYDRIKELSVEELAEYIYTHDDDLDMICKSSYDTCPFGDDVEPSNCKECVKKMA